MDATALRTVPTIRTVQSVTSSVIVPWMNFVILWWAVLKLRTRHILYEKRLHNKVQTTLQITSAVVLRAQLVTNLNQYSINRFQLHKNTYLSTLCWYEVCASALNIYHFSTAWSFCYFHFSGHFLIIANIWSRKSLMICKIGRNSFST